MTTPRQDTHAIPESYDRPDPANTLENRFKAWRNLVENLESYFKHLEKTHEGTAKDYNKLSKTIDLPFKDRGVFEQSGVQDIFAGLQQNAAKLSNDYGTHAKSVDNTLVKSPKNLSSDIKDFIKRLEKDGVKGGKAVTKNQSETQKHIDLLGTHISKGKGGQSLKPTEDPFVTHRGILSRLDGQVQEENAHQATLIALQNECAQFEAKIVKTIQELVGQMGAQASAQAQGLTTAHQQLTNNTNTISPSSEWNAFVARDRTLADPNAPPRTAKAIAFPGSDHELTKPVIEGDIFRKGTVIKKYNSAYYVLTQSGFLHEFKSKSFESDPDPAWSLDIKQSHIGHHSSQASGKAKWTISGKTKGLMSSKHDFQFQATSYEDMLQWWTAIRKFAASGASADEVATADDSDTEPTSPVQQQSGFAAQPASTIDQKAAPAGNTQAAPATAHNAYGDVSSPTSTASYAQTPTPQQGAGTTYAQPSGSYAATGDVPNAAHGAA